MGEDVEQVKEGGDGEGLGEDLVGAEGAGGALGVGPGGGHDGEARRAAAAGAGAAGADEVEAVHAGHDEVEEDDVGGPAAHGLERFEAVGGGLDVVALAGGGTEREGLVWFWGSAMDQGGRADSARAADAAGTGAGSEGGLAAGPPLRWRGWRESGPATGAPGAKEMEEKAVLVGTLLREEGDVRARLTATGRERMRLERLEREGGGEEGERLERRERLREVRHEESLLHGRLAEVRRRVAEVRRAG